MESSDGEEWGRDEDEDRGRMAKEDGNSATQSWSCSQCQTHYTVKENYITHMSEQHGKVRTSSRNSTIRRLFALTKCFNTPTSKKKEIIYLSVFYTLLFNSLGSVRFKKIYIILFSKDAIN